MSRPSPHELWKQSAGDHHRYIEVMIEHGYIIPQVSGLTAEITSAIAESLPTAKKFVGQAFVHVDVEKNWRELEPIPLYLTCPKCSAQHVDVGVFATTVHRDHACQNCGLCWRPALVPTVGVQYLPGYKD